MKHEQEEMSSHARQLWSRDKLIDELRATVARHERANGRLVAELQEARETARNLSAKAYAHERLAMQEAEPRLAAYGVGSMVDAVVGSHTYRCKVVGLHDSGPHGWLTVQYTLPTSGEAVRSDIRRENVVRVLS